MTMTTIRQSWACHELPRLPEALLRRLSPTEAHLVAVLHEAGGEWVSRVDIAEAVWGRHVWEPDDPGHIVRVNINRARARLAGSGWCIENLAGYGRYRLVQAA
jgi:DNA-binding response OmpR family regulator